MTRAIVLLLALVASGCHLTINEGSSTNTNTNTGGNGGSNGNPTGPTPTPTPTPTPGSPGSRTPDPPLGTVLPFPTYTATTVASVPFVTQNTCLSFAYLDAVVDALRRSDTRWGYACASSGCAASSLDKIAYHATAGPETVGATGNWLVDLIVDVCGPGARNGFDVSYDTTAGWTGRGRF